MKKNKKIQKNESTLSYGSLVGRPRAHSFFFSTHADKKFAACAADPSAPGSGVRWAALHFFLARLFWDSGMPKGRRATENPTATDVVLGTRDRRDK